MRNLKGQFIRGSNGWKGRKHSEETKKKISLNHKRPFLGKKLSEKTRLKMSNGRKGMVFSQEHKSNLSKSHVGKYTGNKSPNWKGDQVGYVAMHYWVVRWKGKPEICENCGKSGLKGHKIHWANIDHKYRRVLEDYIRLCVKCHMQYDKKI